MDGGISVAYVQSLRKPAMEANPAACWRKQATAMDGAANSQGTQEENMNSGVCTKLQKLYLPSSIKEPQTSYYPILFSASEGV